ncbi:contact-dependent growth inhibition system immunity protein [Nocardia harenae]|uniref:contact-dependent growth inhibition system immunity protein n=1 Tax=Nocardia harenae TaxID=358707 RepID=UPI000B18AC19|nr:contact-dependent growth inhibition system immunity protein [Nocardia harenae]
MSIEQWEGSWPDPGPEATELIRTVHRLRRLPLSKLTAEDIRILLAQRVAVPILLPIALDIIDAAPLASGDMYPGDLLVAVLRAAVSYPGTAPHHDRLSVAIERVRARGGESVPNELWEHAAALGLC